MVQNPLVYKVLYHPGGFPGGASGKRTRPPVQETRDAGSIPGSGRPSGEGRGNPVQYSYLETPLDRGAWWAAAHMLAQLNTPEAI